MALSVDVDPIFLIGLITFLGYFAILLFEKKRISQVITLILIGIIIGPILNIVDTSPESVVNKISPFLATLALIFLLFDGGLNLNLVRALSEFPKASLFTLVIFALTSLTTAYVMQSLADWDFIHGLLLGVILGGTSSAIIIAIVENAKLGKDVKTFLTLESAITDILVVVIASTIITITLLGDINFKGVLSYLTSSFTTSIIFGILGAVFWIYAIERLEEKNFSYMLTISFALIVYSLSSLSGGNGSFAVFVFALVLGNTKLISKYVKVKLFDKFSIDRRIKTFQEETTFFIRTFFFVYIGLVIPFNNLLNPFVISISLVLSLAYLLLRFFVVKFMLGDVKRDEKFVVTTSMGRGLAAAVVASIALNSGITIPYFIEIIFSVILLSNLITTWGLFTHHKYVMQKDETREKNKNKNTNNSNEKAKRKNKTKNKKNKNVFIDWMFR